MGNNMKKGFSIIEVILAVALFVIFSSGTVAVVLYGLDIGRVGKEQTIATQYASEGIEAVRSIRNQKFSNLVNSNGVGVIKSGGVWAFSGVNNVFEKYTRVITIADVYRDINGNISISGSLDPFSKAITSSVTWNMSISRSNSVVLKTYLSDWLTVTGTPPTLTPTVMPTNTPTPTPLSTCGGYCISQGIYTTGICRQNPNRCTQNNEINNLGGDIYCPTGNKSCCCK